MLEGGPSGRLVSLSNRVSPAFPLEPAGGIPITYANDLDIAADGTVFFTDCQNITTALNRRAGEGVACLRAGEGTADQ